MTRVISILQRGQKALADLNLLRVLQSEILHENSNPRFQDAETGSLGDFKVDWDSNQSQDVVLRRRCDSGEEVAVSALLYREHMVSGTVFPREALLKVCIKKPGLSSIMQFDCLISEIDKDKSDFYIQEARYLRSPISARPSLYQGPSFGTLDHKLQFALKEYLIARGISESLTNFILYHLNKKEQDQYVDWLGKLESTMATSEQHN